MVRLLEPLSGSRFYLGSLFQRLLCMNVHYPHFWGQLATGKTLLLVTSIRLCSGPALSTRQPQLLCTCRPTLPEVRAQMAWGLQQNSWGPFSRLTSHALNGSKQSRSIWRRLKLSSETQLPWLLPLTSLSSEPKISPFSWDKNCSSASFSYTKI